MDYSEDTFASGNYVWGGNPGIHGIKYEKDLAFALFVRASLRKAEFQLATEMEVAGKFDDVVIFFKEHDLKEVWLIQAKHSEMSDNTNRISFNNLFPKTSQGNKDFVLKKYIQSYLSVVQLDEFKEYDKRFFILTNKSFDDGDEKLKALFDIEICEVHPVMKFSQSDNCYRRIKPKDDTIDDLLEIMNTELTAIKHAIITLFESGKVSDILVAYKIPVKEILKTVKEGSKKYLKFSDNFLARREDPAHEWLYEQLVKVSKFENISTVKTTDNLEDKTIENFMKGNSRATQLPTYLAENNLREFFQHLTFCIEQPSDLTETVKNDLHSWMRDWIPPDDLGKAQSELPFAKFEESFTRWNLNNDSKQKKKDYLSYMQGRECVEEITREMGYHLKQGTKIYSFYIERKLIVNPAIVSDKTFIERLINNQGENKFLLFIGEPGMGKTTLLQYIAFEVQRKSKIDVFLIYLNKLKETLTSVGDCEQLETVYNVLRSVIFEQNLKILKNNLENNANRTIIMFDGFDEISFHSEAIALFNQLLLKMNFQVIVSGRYHVKDILETVFKVRAIRMIPFKNLDQIHFLQKSWNISHGSEEFGIYSTQLLEKFHSDIKSYEYNFFGIPLMIRLLAIVYSDDFQQYLKTDQDKREQDIFSQQNFNVVSLVKKFVQFSFQIKWKKKNDQDAYRHVDMSTDEEINRQLKYFITEHQIAACDQLSIYKLKEIVASGENKEIYDHFQKRIKNGEENSPLLNNVDGILEFVHASYAEFFVAMYLYDHIKQCEAILYQTLQEYGTVRRFFYMLTEEASPEKSDQLSILKRKDFVFWACEANCVKVVNKLLEKRNFKSKKHKEYGSLLHIATGAGNQEMVSCLLNHGINVNLLANYKYEVHFSVYTNVSALHIASAFGHLKITELLLDRFTKVDQKDKNKRTPLHYASDNGHLQIAKLLLDRSANVDRQDKHNRTPLHYASKKGHREIATLLLDRSANVDHQDKNNRTPLHEASDNEQTKMVELLLDRNANVDHQNKDNGTPLHYASDKGYVKIAELLLNRSAEVDHPDKDNRTALHYACNKGHLKIVQLLLNRFANVDHQDVNKRSPLHYASEYGQLEVAKLLLDRFADVNHKDKDSRTPLHYACQRGLLDIVKHLLVRSAISPAYVDHQDINKRTPLHCAAIGPNPIKPKENEVHVHKIIEPDYLEIVKLLLGHQPVNVNAKDSTGSTPLHYAACYGSLNMVKLLLDNNANASILDKHNMTPRDVAVENHRSEVADFFTITSPR